MKGRADVAHLREQVKAATDLPQLLGELGLEQPRPGGLWLCPFHRESDGSLSVHRTFFRCFGCGERGDCFSLLMKLFGWTFRQAFEYLATRAGIPLPWKTKAERPVPPVAKRPAPSKQEPEPPAMTLERRASILTPFCEVARFREWQTPSNCPALAYLERRGISAATAQACGLGWVGDYRRASEWLLARNPLEDLQAAGLFSKKTGNLTPYRHRLLIPYWLDGQVFALQVRNIDWKGKHDGRKELCLTPVAIPFNADVLLREPDRVFITEGSIDALSLVEQGFSAVAIPGASSFKPSWVPLFEGWQVVLALDADGPGRAGAERIAKMFNAASQMVRVLELPDGQDVNDYLRAAA